MDRQPRRSTTSDPAIMLFGKQIKSVLPILKAKEELSPRGVNERGVSVATTSSDEEDDLNANVEASSEDAPKTLEKRTGSHEEEDPMELAPVAGTAQVEQSEMSKSSEVMRLTSKEIKMEMQDCNDCNLSGDLSMPSCSTRREWSEKMQRSNEVDCQRGGDDEVHKHLLMERELGKLKGVSWSQCPRCNSTDTKFCYFNNYNINQPRHFCKHCQRYWTAGGTLRNVPIGAGKRKNKHGIRKDALPESPLSASNVTTLLDAPVSLKLPTAEAGAVNNADYHVPASEMRAVNTDLELSALCIQSHNTSVNIPSQRQHSLTALQQSQMGLPSGSSPSCPNLAVEYPQSGQECSNLTIVPSKFRPLCPCEAQLTEATQLYSAWCAKFSENCAKFSDGRTNSAGLNQFSPDLRSGSSSESTQIHHPARQTRLSADVQTWSAKMGPDLAKTSSDLAKVYPILADGSYQNCLLLPKCSCGSSNPNHRNEAGLSTTDQESARNGFPSSYGLRADHCVKGQSSVPVVWPFVFNMYHWLHSVALHPHLKPILTPQGWAVPFIPPCLSEACSSITPPPTLGMPECTNTSSSSLMPPLASESSSTCKHQNTPSLGTLNLPNAPSPRISADAPDEAANEPNLSHHKRLHGTSSFTTHDGCCHRGAKCSRT